MDIQTPRTSVAFDYEPDYKNHEGEPERVLWAAVIERAAKDIIHAKNMTTAHSAMSWFDSELSAVPSFRFCCEALGLDYSYYRKMAKELFDQRVKVKGPIDNVRHMRQGFTRRCRI